MDCEPPPEKGVGFYVGGRQWVHASFRLLPFHRVALTTPLADFMPDPLWASVQRVHVGQQLVNNFVRGANTSGCFLAREKIKVEAEAVHKICGLGEPVAPFPLKSRSLAGVVSQCDAVMSGSAPTAAALRTAPPGAAP